MRRFNSGLKERQMKAMAAYCVLGVVLGMVMVLVTFIVTFICKHATDKQVNPAAYDVLKTIGVSLISLIAGVLIGGKLKNSS